MICTITGGFIAGFIAYAISKIFNISTYSNRFMPSARDLFMFVAVIIGCGIGFGYGSGQLIAGTHFYNRLYARLLGN